MNINDAARISALISIAFTHLRGKSASVFFRRRRGLHYYSVSISSRGSACRVFEDAETLARRSVGINEEAKRVNERVSEAFQYGACTPVYTGCFVL